MNNNYINNNNKTNNNIRYTQENPCFKSKYINKFYWGNIKNLTNQVFTKIWDKVGVVNKNDI